MINWNESEFILVDDLNFQYARPIEIDHDCHLSPEDGCEFCIQAMGL
jgi:hypothetical protein